MLKSIAAGLAVAVTLGLSAQANAAPGATSLGELKTTANEASPVEKAHWNRHCWWHRGHRHCRHVWVRPHRYHWGFRHHYYSRYGYYGHRHFWR